LFGLIRTVIPQ